MNKPTDDKNGVPNSAPDEATSDGASAVMKSSDLSAAEARVRFTQEDLEA